MENKIKNKTNNLLLVEETIKELQSDFFTNHDIVKVTGLNYIQVRKYLGTLIDFNKIQYSETSKMYMRL